MEDAFGSMILESNGLSYMKFDLEIYHINQSNVEARFVFSLKLLLGQLVNLGNILGHGLLEFLVPWILILKRRRK